MFNDTRLRNTGSWTNYEGTLTMTYKRKYQIDDYQGRHDCDVKSRKFGGTNFPPDFLSKTSDPTCREHNICQLECDIIPRAHHKMCVAPWWLAAVLS